MGKYAHYSDIDPEFEKVKAVTEKMVDQLFSLPVKEMRAAFAVEPPRPEDFPENIETEDKDVTVRDGAKIPIRIYKAPDVKPDATLYYVMHGGGG